MQQGRLDNRIIRQITRVVCGIFAIWSVNNQSELGGKAQSAGLIIKSETFTRLPTCCVL